MDSSILQGIDSPAAMRTLPRSRLQQLVHEVRAFILNSVSRTGGHLASNLGTVELTVALHWVLDTPADRLVWDVGHQCYAHKVLTGRRELMAGLRSQDGISGFPRRCESVYDVFGTAHSSTSISAALGIALALRRQSDSCRRVVAVIGDGAMQAGMAFEALNHAGVADSDILVVLNDNDMSISAPVGGLRNHLQSLTKGDRHRSLFEDLGFSYFGPVNGHDLDELIESLEAVRDAPGPKLLHVVTRKGFGYGPAEADPIAYHAPGRFSPAEGLMPRPVQARKTFSQIFGDWLCDMAAVDERLVGITPAMCEGSGMNEFARRFPDRYHDVGIAEQHAVTFAAGLACEGRRPVVAIYSTFLQRAYDQLVHDVALQNLPVVFAIDRAGLAGQDGPTHAGAYDIAFLRCIPNMVLIAPADERECRHALNAAFLHDGPVSVRYPRGAGAGRSAGSDLEALPFGKGEIVRAGAQTAIGATSPRVAILAFGTVLHAALEAAVGLDATVANMRFIKPLDDSLVIDLAQRHDVLVTVEEGCIAGGAGSAVAELLQREGISTQLQMLGLPDRFMSHGDASELLAAAGLDGHGIEKSVRQRFNLRPVLVRQAANG